MTHIEARTQLAELYDQMRVAEEAHMYKALKRLALRVIAIAEALAETGDYSFLPVA
jgi:hypothetical protein